MLLVYVLLAVLFFSFCAVILRGAPYLPTLRPQILTSFELAGLKKGDTLLELGSGDGKVLIEAAKQGIYSVGYELNPVLALISWIRTVRYRRYVRIIWGDFWTKSWPEADAIFVFLLDRYMKKLDKKCMQYHYKPVKLVSFVFRIPGKKVKKESNSIALYEYGR